MLNSVVLKISCGCLLMGLTSACSQYLDHNEGVSLSAGDAVAQNKAIHMIDPWPRYARRTHIPGDGTRLLVGLKTYRENKPSEPAKTDTQSDTGKED